MRATQLPCNYGAPFDRLNHLLQGMGAVTRLWYQAFFALIALAHEGSGQITLLDIELFDRPFEGYLGISSHDGAQQLTALSEMVYAPPLLAGLRLSGLGRHAVVVGLLAINGTIYRKYNAK
jgi:hypothetical protein